MATKAEIEQRWADWQAWAERIGTRPLSHLFDLRATDQQNSWYFRMLWSVDATGRIAVKVKREDATHVRVMVAGVGWGLSSYTHASSSRKYGPNDRVFTPDEMVKARSHTAETVAQDVERAMRDAGTNPYAFLQYFRIADGLSSARTSRASFEFERVVVRVLPDMAHMAFMVALIVKLG